MMGRTHLLLGIGSLWLLQPLQQVLAGDALAPMIVVAAFGALLPDLDAQGSTIKYLQLGGVTPFVPIANALHRSLGHRGLLHSLRGLGLCALLFSPLLLWEWRLWLALLLGYVSHLLGDAATKSGIPLFYPDPRRRHLLPRPWRLATGSQAEDALLPLLAILDLALLLSHLPSLSTL